VASTTVPPSTGLPSMGKLMNWLANLSTRNKLLFGFGLLLALLMLTTTVGYQTVVGMREVQRQLVEVDLADAMNALELRADTFAQRATMLELIVAAKQDDIDSVETRLQQRAGRVDQTLEALATRPRELGIAGPALELTLLLKEFRRVRQQQIDLLREDDRTAALALEQQQIVRYDRLEALVDELREHALLRANNSTKSVAQQVAGALQWFALFAVLAIVVALFVATLLTRSIATPLQQLTALADRIAAGDLSAQVTTTSRRDEVGLLILAFERMTRALRTVAGAAERIAAGDLRGTVAPQSERDVLGNAFARMSSDLRNEVRELLDATTVLSGATSEIVASTAQLASSANESAAAVSETTATVEEVRQTVQMSSQKARLVSDMSQRAVQTAQEGRRSTESMLDGMRNIRQQMDAIAASMTHLSDQSHAIGQIIASVEDLAVQSKLLAVNASIEAAKAGEHGKGFVVVAQEVKSLAEQSRYSATSRKPRWRRSRRPRRAAAQWRPAKASRARLANRSRASPPASAMRPRRRCRSPPRASSSWWAWIRSPRRWRTSSRPLPRTSPARPSWSPRHAISTRSACS
jgi:methyl-accepting chemotaxis protein